MYALYTPLGVKFVNFDPLGVCFRLSPVLEEGHEVVHTGVFTPRARWNWFSWPDCPVLCPGVVFDTP
jgi:hypothetical protein